MRAVTRLGVVSARTTAQRARTPRVLFSRALASAASQTAAQRASSDVGPEFQHLREQPAKDTPKHFKLTSNEHPLELTKAVQAKGEWLNPMDHPVYTPEDLASVEVTHRPCETTADKVAYGLVRACRFGYDFFSGWTFGYRTPGVWLNRIIFLETFAGVPGMTAGMVRHLNSLRRMRRDHGWIHTLLEEAENERMHLLTFMTMKQPGSFFRFMVIAAQGVSMNLFFTVYLFWPQVCHRFVGYLEEQAVKTYTQCLAEIDAGKLWKGELAPLIARHYWNLPKGATMRDVIAAVRADEANHKFVNHTLASLDQNNATNPFIQSHPIGAHLPGHEPIWVPADDTTPTPPAPTLSSSASSTSSFSPRQASQTTRSNAV